jgi:hypothetical protein
LAEVDAPAAKHWNVSSANSPNVHRNAFRSRRSTVGEKIMTVFSGGWMILAFELHLHHASHGYNGGNQSVAN